METAKITISVIAVLISIASFVIAQRSAARAKRAQAITNLLGEKESVAFAALRLLRDGLPKDRSERVLVISALLQACVFEGSDRARALLYRVIELNRAAFRAEFQTGLTAIKETFESMDRYAFKLEELDLSRGKRRLSALERIISTP